MKSGNKYALWSSASFVKHFLVRIGVVHILWKRVYTSLLFYGCSYLRDGCYVLPGVCLSVCPLTTSRKKLPIGCFIFGQGSFCQILEVLTLDQDPGSFWGILQHCKIELSTQFGLGGGMRCLIAV